MRFEEISFWNKIKQKLITYFEEILEILIDITNIGEK